MFFFNLFIFFFRRIWDKVVSGSSKILVFVAVSLLVFFRRQLLMEKSIQGVERFFCKVRYIKYTVIHWSHTIVKSLSWQFWITILFNLLTAKSDQHVISPYNIILKSHIKVMRIKEMVTNYRGS